jgi:hypothetical protein
MEDGTMKRMSISSLMSFGAGAMSASYMSSKKFSRKSLEN